MDEIELKISSRLDIFDELADEVDIFVNGENLRDLARRVESPFATEEGDPRRAGGYAGLPPEAVFAPSERLLGKPSAPYDDDEEKVSLLGCGCGVVGCWPLMARISLEGEVVKWSGFEQPHRSGEALFFTDQRVVVWRYGGLGPFMFERRRYLAELAKFEPRPKSSEARRI